MECLRDCGWGSVEALESLDRRGGGASVTSATSADRAGARIDDASILGFVGTSWEVPGEVVSGLAMRRPPNDWERLRSLSMASTTGVPVYVLVSESWLGGLQTEILGSVMSPLEQRSAGGRGLELGLADLAKGWRAATERARSNSGRGRGRMGD